MITITDMSQKVYGYLRVSTDRQDEESQRHTISTYAARNLFNDPEYFLDKITGRTPWTARDLNALAHSIEPGSILLISEITRIERTMHGILTFLKHMQEKPVQVHIIKSNLIVNDEMNSKILVGMLAIAGEIELDLNNARARAGVATRRAKGLPLGRQPGTIVKLKLDEFRSDIPKWREKKLSLRSIAKLTDSSVPTVKRWLARQETATTTDAPP